MARFVDIILQKITFYTAETVRKYHFTKDLIYYSPKFCLFVQSLSLIQLYVTPQATARQASLCVTSSQSLLKFTSLESVMVSNYLILCFPLLLLPSVFPSIRAFSDESVLCIRRPKYWSFNFSISPFNE